MNTSDRSDGSHPATGDSVEAEVRRLLTTLTRFLASVALLALVFTAVNVTLFAVASGIPWPIAILLDPLVALTLTAVLYADARLAALGVRPPGWSTALRWGSGLTAALLNTWSSLWPDRQLGWPTNADVAGVVLHMVPPLMLIGLTETVAAYRRTLADLTRAPDSRPTPSSVTGTSKGRPESLSGSPTEPSAIHNRSASSSADPQHRTTAGPPTVDRSAAVLGFAADRARTTSTQPSPAAATDPRSAPPIPASSPVHPRPRPETAPDGGHLGPHTADDTPTTAPVDPHTPAGRRKPDRRRPVHSRPGPGCRIPRAVRPRRQHPPAPHRAPPRPEPRPHPARADRPPPPRPAATLTAPPVTALRQHPMHSPTSAKSSSAIRLTT
ncbi:extensin [Streptomyces boninensis]|uniref:extensin n=1 Tax=Streptomyces boninensis TaxID=2039455 RepID=UPI003B2288FC